ncbi:hypothetical protein EKH77_04315 [Streptomyces luteoverticillatus]|uniref:Uncharacterized protein n=1 Tax=Streptomyces luteoverticillatus TaxID=66425 RepID=A0A3Q9FTV2_STRLT|nr:hypothetical protein [Streptomyces luteoverticillatus]AZQ70542.1 hypothetical protein EKH77_04315 [Streptomyces luteoverticillatus]
MGNDRPGRGEKAASHLAAEELGARYAVAKDAVECLDFGMSVKEAVQQARTAEPAGRQVTPQQVVQGAHDIISAGPDEDMDMDVDEDVEPGTGGDDHGPTTQ